MELSDLQASKDTMPGEEYLISRLKIKSKMIDFKKIGDPISEKDDLKDIDGIDENLESRLNAVGINSYSQVSKFEGIISENIEEVIEYFPGRIKRQLWREQALELMK